MYDPTVGRFLEEDPIGFAAGDANLYRYVGNGPTNATDPSGRIPAPRWWWQRLVRDWIFGPPAPPSPPPPPKPPSALPPQMPTFPPGTLVPIGLPIQGLIQNPRPLLEVLSGPQCESGKDGAVVCLSTQGFGGREYTCFFFGVPDEKQKYVQGMIVQMEGPLFFAVFRYGDFCRMLDDPLHNVVY